MDIKNIMLLIKKSFWLMKNKYLVSGLSIKPARNNDITKWDDFDKIKTLSEIINDSKK